MRKMFENDIIIKMSTAGGRMKFLFAPDSFKGTMSAININRLLRHATHRVLGSVEYINGRWWRRYSGNCYS